MSVCSLRFRDKEWFEPKRPSGKTAKVCIGLPKHVLFSSQPKTFGEWLSFDEVRVKPNISDGSDYTGILTCACGAKMKITPRLLHPNLMDGDGKGVSTLAMSIISLRPGIPFPRELALFPRYTKFLDSGTFTQLYCYSNDSNPS